MQPMHTVLIVKTCVCFGCRYLKSCVWQAEKKKEMQERKLVQTLYSDLVDTVKLNGLNKKVSLHVGTITDVKGNQ